MSAVVESTVEDAVLSWPAELGDYTIHGEDIAPDTWKPERRTYGEVILLHRLRSALIRVHPFLPVVANREVIRKVVQIDAPKLLVLEMAV